MLSIKIRSSIMVLKIHLRVHLQKNFKFSIVAVFFFARLERYNHIILIVWHGYLIYSNCYNLHSTNTIFALTIYVKIMIESQAFQWFRHRIVY